MTDFIYNTPTKVVFGKESEARLPELLQEQGVKKVLVHYGKGSVQRSGLLQRIEASLTEAGISYCLLGGVVPNPQLSLVREGINLCQSEKVDFILAVGGGSVLDSAKAIALGAVATDDVWEFFEQTQMPKACLPIGSVLTIAAAGSEMSNSVVITNDEIQMKRGAKSELVRCRFAIMNPELTMSLSQEQTAVGVADILMHTLERYFTSEPNTMMLTDSIAEGLLRTVMYYGGRLMRKPQDYKARAEVMWAGALSHNGLTGAGSGNGDWACHQLSHGLSGTYNIAHGAALTAVWGSWARYVYKEQPERFASLAEQVLEIEPMDSEEETALAGIEEMEEYFWSLELPTNISEAGIELTEDEIKDLAARCTYFGKRSIGGVKVLGEKEIADIFRFAAKANKEE